LVTIYPFEDGNGRTARLMTGYILDYYGYGFNGIGSFHNSILLFNEIDKSQVV